jgi:hypothetical protein
MPDEIDAAPGTTEGADAPGETDEERNLDGEREQGVRTERSEDLSSPRFTVHEGEEEGSG